MMASINAQLQSDGSYSVSVASLTSYPNFSLVFGGQAFTINPLDLVAGYTDDTRQNFSLTVQSANAQGANGEAIAIVSPEVATWRGSRQCHGETGLSLIPFPGRRRLPQKRPDRLLVLVQRRTRRRLPAARVFCERRERGLGPGQPGDDGESAGRADGYAGHHAVSESASGWYHRRRRGSVERGSGIALVVQEVCGVPHGKLQLGRMLRARTGLCAGCGILTAESAALNSIVHFDTRRARRPDLMTS
jgi:hypothetical protein